MTQLELFKNEDVRPKRRKPSGGSQNPIVFRDYESYVAKFVEGPKTTDDTFTPRDIYEAVVEYVGTVVDLSDKQILRPFYPGGDYENAEYPDNGVVIDNPPFSLFMKIVRFYVARDIPFFLFGPGLTIASCCKYCTAVIIGEGIRFENGAVVKCNFASNLYGDVIIKTAPYLDKLIKQCPSQPQKANLPKYEYPDNVVSVSDMQTIAHVGGEYEVRRKEGIVIRDLDNHPGRGLFGDHILTTNAKGEEKVRAKATARAAANQMALFNNARRQVDIETNTTRIQLSEREKRIVERLDASSK